MIEGFRRGEVFEFEGKVCKRGGKMVEIINKTITNNKIKLCEKGRESVNRVGEHVTF